MRSVVLAVVVAIGGCSAKNAPEPSVAPVELPPTTTTTSARDGDPDLERSEDVAASVAATQQPAVGEPPGACPPLLQSTAPDYQMEASHILVAYEGALRAKAGVTRSKDEALTKARDLYRALKGGANFADLARTESDGPSGNRGGYLGSFKFSQMVAPFSEAVAALQPEEFCLVETRFGYHLVLRR